MWYVAGDWLPGCAWQNQCSVGSLSLGSPAWTAAYLEFLNGSLVAFGIYTTVCSGFCIEFPLGSRQHHACAGEVFGGVASLWDRPVDLGGFLTWETLAGRGLGKEEEIAGICALAPLEVSFVRGWVGLPSVSRRWSLSQGSWHFLFTDANFVKYPVL